MQTAIGYLRVKADFGLGHRHAMAIVALLKGLKGDSSPKKPDRTARKTERSGQKASKG